MVATQARSPSPDDRSGDGSAAASASPFTGPWTAALAASALAVVGLGVYAWIADDAVMALLLAVPFVIVLRVAWRRREPGRE